ncbi:hypothetical protein D3C85_1269850 [compost metagenome]
MLLQGGVNAHQLHYNSFPRPSRRIDPIEFPGMGFYATVVAHDCIQGASVALVQMVRGVTSRLIQRTGYLVQRSLLPGERRDIRGLYQG